MQTMQISYTSNDVTSRPINTSSYHKIKQSHSHKQCASNNNGQSPQHFPTTLTAAGPQTPPTTTNPILAKKARLQTRKREQPNQRARNRDPQRLQPILHARARRSRHQTPHPTHRRHPPLPDRAQYTADERRGTGRDHQHPRPGERRLCRVRALCGGRGAEVASARAPR